MGNRLNPSKRYILIVATLLILFVPLLVFSVQMGKRKSVANKDALNQKIDMRIAEYLQKHQKNALMSSAAPVDEKFLTLRIEEGIEKFIQKQKQAQQQAQVKREQDAGRRAKNVRRVSKTRDHIYGNPDAEISLIEYSDFECPFCKRFHPTAKKIVEAYGGKVNWVYRHFPLGFHNPLAQKEAEASECANELGGNTMFWKYADLIYARTKSNGRGFPINKLAPLAEEIGLDKGKFETCLDSGKYTGRVQEDFREGSSIGISGTPGNILLHNKTGAVVVKSGAYPFEAFKSDIDKLLK